MDAAPSIAFRGIRGSNALKSFIVDHARKLETYKQPITGCHITVKQGDHRHKTGRRYFVSIAVTLPGGEVTVTHERNARPVSASPARRSTREDAADPQHKHVRLAVGDAFAIARRQIQNFATRRRHE